MKLALDTITLDDAVTAAEVLRAKASAWRAEADNLNPRRAHYLRVHGYLLSRAESCEIVASMLLSGAKVE